MSSLSSFLDAGVLVPLDLFFAERVLSEEAGQRPEHTAFLAVSFAVFRQGHLAFSLEKMEETLKTLPAKCAFDVQGLAQMVRHGAESLPPCCAKVVQESEGMFYMQKNGAYEQEIALHIRRLTRAGLPPISLADPPGLLNTEQKAALENAAAHPMSLLFGGPGTGKTYTAAQVIHAFLAQDREHKMRIAIAAPTGKAVAQLDAYLRHHFTDDKRIRLGTCHALLGLKKETTGEPERNILFADLLLIDECSMIDVHVFTRLLASVLEGTRVILVGDPDQLPAVEAGSIFADLVTCAEESGLLPFAKLKRSLRSDRDEILSFAESIRRGNVEGVRHSLDASPSDAIVRVDVELKEPRAKKVHQYLYDAFKDQFISFFAHEPASTELNTDFRLLSCMRQGPFGVDTLNSFFAAQFLKEAKEHSGWAIPILITRSDYGLQLFNGDAGFLIKRISSSLSLTEASKEEYALFPARAQKIPALALPAFEWGYCLSVHKSQGSEYDEVFVLIPEGSHVFGREVLYTAATRARRRVRIAGSLEQIEKVVQNSARKISGLSARLKKIMKGSL
jgi:exodeoxyribonuclease V alpha subunit